MQVFFQSNRVSLSEFRVQSQSQSQSQSSEFKINHPKSLSMLLDML